MRLPILTVAATLFLTSCESVRFYSQAVRGQWEMIAKAQPVEKLLAAGPLDSKLRQQLQKAMQIREFAAAQLHLPVQGQYDVFVDLGRPHVSWVVMAAPEFSVEPKRWWYPVLGKLDYRGYFSEKDAQSLGNRLKEDGWDVAMGGVDAYSTLGIFRDPLLNTFLFEPDTDLAELLFHELAHQKVFLSGDTDFNEAFATSVAQEGVQRWLIAAGQHRELAHYRQRLHEESLFVAEVLRTREELQALYARQPDISSADLHQEKAAVFSRLQLRIRSLPELKHRKEYANWVAKPLNNARLNTISAYHQLVPAFHRLLAQEQQSLPAYYAAVQRLERLTKKQRRAKLGLPPE